VSRTIELFAGVVLLDERPRRRQWLGIGLVIVAVTAIAAVGG